MVGKEPAIRPTRINAAHLVQLFDSEESLADRVAEFFREGLLHNDRVLAVMDEARWYTVAMRLSALGWPIDDALRLGHVVVRGSRGMLDRFMVGSRPKPQLFSATVGAQVSQMASLGRPVRIYGEMVDVLAEQGEYTAAYELECLWNELGQSTDFTLMCGYGAGHFGDPRYAGDLRRICAAHDGLLSSPRDVLAPFLLRSYNAA